MKSADHETATDRSRGESTATDYVWHAKTNRSFIARCHIESGNTWLRFEFDSDIGLIERPEDVQGNPIFIVSDGGKRLCVRGAVTIPAQDAEQKGTVTFTPQEEGITEWHWTLTRDGEAYTKEGRGMFRRYEPPRSRAKKHAAIKNRPVRKKKPVSKKAARKKTPTSKKKPVGKRKQLGRVGSERKLLLR